jgi:hypothetical protein
LTTGPQVRVDDGGDHVDVGDAAVGGPRLGSLEDPFVLRLVVRRLGAHRAHVTSRVGLGGAERAELEVAGRAVHLRDPLHDLLVGAVGPDAGGRERGADDGEPDPGVTPEQLLHADREAEPGLVRRLGDDEVHGVQAGLRRLFDDRPGELLLLVPLGGRRPDHVRGESVHPLAQVEVVLAELEGRRCHPLNLSG